MNYIWNRLSAKPTFISILGVLLILILIPVGIYGYVTSEPSTEAWAIAFTILTLLVVLLYYIDRVLANHINNKLLTLIEFVLFLAGSLLFMYSSRELNIDLDGSKQNFVLIVQNTGDLVNTASTSKSLFDKEVKTTENLIIVDQIPKATKLIKRPASWQHSNYYNLYSLGKYKKVVLYSDADHDIDKKMTESFIDSIIESRPSIP